LKTFFENHRGSGAARFFYEPSRRGSGSFSAAMDISGAMNEKNKKIC
jgi:aspartate carbamoyltransferase catalytic subunit